LHRCCPIPALTQQLAHLNLAMAALPRTARAVVRQPMSIRAAAALCAALPAAVAQGQCRKFSSSGSVPTLHVGVVGYGLVGKELVQQVLDNAKPLQSELGVGLEVTAVARSKTMTFLNQSTQQSLSGGAWPSGDEALDLKKLGDHLLKAASESGGRAIVVDNTAADAPVEFYEQWLSSGIDVATPNKRAGSGPYNRYENILAAAKTGSSSFMYEATVGAGLPLIAPLQNLRRAGDEVTAVEGIFSGTLSYIFNSWKPGIKYSDVVADAKVKGFTEPDPRDDLGGTDVQRKVTIIARELGLKLELDDVPVESLVPEKLRNWEPPAGAVLADAFIDELKNYDDEMTALLDAAEAANEVLRFVGSIDMKAGTASVKLGRFPKDHPFAGTQFADNIAAFDSKWYTPRPLVIQGPGAGAAVTAAGIFGDIMQSMKVLRR